MLPKIIFLNKKVGETPLDAIREFRIKNSEFRDVKMGYAGRLDPMAEGLLLVMVGEECKNREKYQEMDKTYEADILLGISTDSYDVLGLVDNRIREDIKQINADPEMSQVRKALKQFKGKIRQKIPPYSAFRIGKYAMYKLARENKMSKGNLPEKEVEIFNLKILRMWELGNDKLEKYIFDKLDKVRGNFRQEEIKEKWKEYFKTRNECSIFHVIKVRIRCSSGTYIRSLAYDLGAKLLIPSMLLALKRTGIGKYSISESGIINQEN